MYATFDPLANPALHAVRADADRLLRESRAFCMAPWTHLSVVPAGHVYPCCYADNFPPVGSLRQQTLAEVWNGPALRQLRLDMLAGKPSPQCQRCHELGQLGQSSLRDWINRDHRHHLPVVRTTQADGTVAHLNLVRLDLRFSNLCNFRCRTCNPLSSTRWYPDAQALGWLEPGQTALQQPAADPEALWRQVEPLVPGLEMIHFVGGEPLIMDEHYRLLNALLAAGRTQVELVYNTNFSTLHYKGQDVMRLWDRFERVSVTASLDGSGRRGEYLRKGQRWAQVVANRERLREVCPRVRFAIAPVLSAMNALHLPDFHREWLDRGWIAPDTYIVNLLTWPDEYRVQVLPRHLKEQVAERYGRHIDSLHDPSNQMRPWFQGALDFMWQADRSDLLGRFRQRTRVLDELRGECFAEVFPEMADLMSPGAGAARA